MDCLSIHQRIQIVKFYYESQSSMKTTIMKFRKKHMDKKMYQQGQLSTGYCVTLKKKVLSQIARSLAHLLLSQHQKILSMQESACPSLHQHQLVVVLRNFKLVQMLYGDLFIRICICSRTRFRSHNS